MSILDSATTRDSLRYLQLDLEEVRGRLEAEDESVLAILDRETPEAWPPADAELEAEIGALRELHRHLHAAAAAIQYAAGKGSAVLHKAETGRWPA